MLYHRIKTTSKQSLSLITILALLFTASPAIAYSNDDSNAPLQDKVVNQATLDKTKELALSGSPDQLGFKRIENGAKLINENTDQEYYIDTFVSNERVVIDSNSIVNTDLTENYSPTYTVESLAVITKKDMDNIQGAASSTVHEATDESWSKNGSVKLWGRFFYKRNLNTVLVTKVTGNWRNLESSRQYISSQSAQASCVDENTQYQAKTWYPSGGFTYNTGFSAYAQTNGAQLFRRIGLSQLIGITNYSTHKTVYLQLIVAPWGWW